MRVLIVDDHKLFADALSSLLESKGIDVLGAVTTGEEALGVARNVKPDLVLLELGLPDLDGVAIGRKILQELPDTKVMALTALRDPRAVKEAMKAGFQGYLTKDVLLSRLVSSIHAVCDGQLVVPHKLASAAIGNRSPEERSADILLDQLTQRERRVLLMLIDGADSKEIARQLSVSPNTVRTHVQNILTKLGVHSRLEAAAFAVRYGFPSSTKTHRRYA